MLRRDFIAGLAVGGAAPWTVARTAGRDDASPLHVVQDGKPLVPVVVAADAGKEEKLAGADLVKYVEMMSGARLAVVTWASGTPAPAGPGIFVGQAALAAEPALSARLGDAAKKDPLLYSDAVAVRRVRDRLLVAGNGDRAHYYAVARLLQEWGCRWYMPTAFGEVVPEHRDLSAGALDIVYGSPFEIRHYWLAWRGDATGLADFHRRNFATPRPPWQASHALGRYTKELVPPGKTAFSVPLSDPQTIDHVASRIKPDYAKGVPGISLAIEDGRYVSGSENDAALQAGIIDKYMLAPANTDAMMTLYNGVARKLRDEHPDSPTKILGLAYSNVTLPPQQVLKIEPNVVMWLAPIDIDPNHGMDDLHSTPRQELKGIMYRWADVMQGRLLIRDYDQGQLIWRDLPNPSQHAFAQDVRHYRKAGILGAFTESRGATSTVFLNLFFRLQLLWNPDQDVDALLAEFYPAFYGPAAPAMARYWTAIFKAWQDTTATEHEHFVAPAIYTRALVATLKGHLAEAQRAVAPLRAKPAPGRNEALYLQRMDFTSLSFDIIENYVGLVHASAAENQYARAAEHGEKALAAREKLTAMNPTFTNYRMGEKGPRWLPGEIEQMRALATLTNGTAGTLLARTPLEWAFRRDATDTGLARGWAYTRADLSHWKTAAPRVTEANRKDYPDAWEMLRTDVYMQGQGVRHPDGHSFTGHYWYQADVELDAAQSAGEVHLLFPGLFNECWLYVNGVLVKHRPLREPWWKNDYRFEWDVDVSGRLRPGANLLTLRGLNPHHFGGMFRRPFLYRPRR